MKFIKVTQESNDAVSFKVIDTVTKIQRDFTLIFKPHPDGSAKLLKDFDFPVVVEDFSYEGLD